MKYFLIPIPNDKRKIVKVIVEFNKATKTSTKIAQANISEFTKIIDLTDFE